MSQIPAQQYFAKPASMPAKRPDAYTSAHLPPKRERLGSLRRGKTVPQTAAVSSAAHDGSVASGTIDTLFPIFDEEASRNEASSSILDASTDLINEDGELIDTPAIPEMVSSYRVFIQDFHAEAIRRKALFPSAHDRI